MDKLLDKSLEFLKRKIIDELKKQGHVATGNLINSIEIKTEKTSEGLKGYIIMDGYANILDKGVKANRVPYSGNTGGGGTSKYIEALIEWIGVIKPSLAQNERKSFAFAIAQKAKKEGHPTKGSFAYSQNGRRTEWSKFAIDDNLQEFENLIDVGRFIATTFDNFITGLKK